MVGICAAMWDAYPSRGRWWDWSLRSCQGRVGGGWRDKGWGKDSQVRSCMIEGYVAGGWGERLRV